MKITMTGTEFNRIMRVCIPALSKDDVRQALRYINIQCNGEGEGCATALDGTILAQTRFNCQGQRGSLFIPAHKTVPNDCEIEITQEEGKISISDGVETITRKVPEFDVIDYAAICKGAQAKKKSITIAFNPKLMMQALKSYKDRENLVCMDIYGAIDAAVLYNDTACGLLMPVRMAYPEERTPVFWDMRENA